MDDLDALLGGPSNNATNKEIDDLLGDSPMAAPSSPKNFGGGSGGGGGLGGLDDELLLDDDDLLGDLGGGGAKGGPSSSSSSQQPAATPIRNRPDPRMEKDNNYNPQHGVRKRAMGTIKAVALQAKDLPPTLLPYLGGDVVKDCYYLRALVVIDCKAVNMCHAHSARLEAPAQRTRVILRVNSTSIQLFSPTLYEVALAGGVPEAVNKGPTPFREIPIEKVFGVTMQSVQLSKLFGSREVEEQVLIQVREDADILVALTRDAANGPVYGLPEHDNDLVQSLSAVTFAYGITLPVSTLHATGEMIEKMMNSYVGKRGDERLRGRQSEQLAYRTDLIRERDTLKAELETMTVAIEKLKVSEIAKTADQIQTDIAEHEKAIAQFRKNVAGQEEKRRQLEHELALINSKIKAESQRREKAAKDSMASAQHEAFKRQVSEFEQMKNAHKRDMDKLSNLISFEERRLAEKEGGPNTFNFNGVLEISDRLEVLEQQNKFLSDQLARGHSNHARQMEVLAVAKKEILPKGREELGSILEEIKMLQQLKERMDMEGDAKIRAQPSIYSELLGGTKISREKPKPLQLPVIKAAEPAVVAPPPPPAAAPAAKPSISLDDDDDDDLVVVPVPSAPAAAPAPKPALNLDDDDI